MIAALNPQCICKEDTPEIVVLSNHSTTEDPATAVLDTRQQAGWNFSSILSSTSAFERGVNPLLPNG